MATIDLSKYGITGTTEIIRNPSYEFLFEEETKAGLEGYDRGQVTDLGAVNVMTGIYTGRSPKDKFIVMDDTSRDTVWWTSDEFKNDNKPASQEAWDACKKLAQEQLSNKRLFVMDVFCGANHDSRMAIRFIMEVAWQAHFVKNMFIQPTAEELENFEPDFISYNAAKAKVENYQELGLNSETAAIFNLTSREQVILNTWYGGEMKKGMFSMMNYYLPLKGMASMHCSANTDMNGENTALFFGLSGTGKTTLSTDPKRLLIGDDEHGWDDNGVFNFEGGCYAKVINLDKDAEPDIYNAIKRNALLENVTVDENGHCDFADDSVTENTRVSYPIDHIEKIVRPVSAGPDAKNVRRRLWRAAPCFHPDPGADPVLLPVRLHLQAGRHRAGHHRAHSHLLRLLRPGLPGVASHQVWRGAGKEDAEVRCQGLLGEHRLERHRQAHLHQGYPRHYRRHSGRLYSDCSHQDHPLLQL